jgi:hypothetical protein
LLRLHYRAESILELLPGYHPIMVTIQGIKSIMELLPGYHPIMVTIQDIEESCLCHFLGGLILLSGVCL